MKVINASITGWPIGGAVIMFVKSFKTDVIVFIGNVIMSVTSH